MTTTNTWRSENEAKSVEIHVSPKSVGIGAHERCTGRVVVRWAATKNNGSYRGAWESPAMTAAKAESFVSAKRATLEKWLTK